MRDTRTFFFSGTDNLIVKIITLNFVRYKEQVMNLFCTFKRSCEFKISSELDI